MARRIPLSIVTPEKVTWEGEVDSLTLPAVDGLMGILPGHAPLLTQLAPGTIVIHEGTDSRPLAVSGGFVEVHKGRVTILAETAELADEIDAERAGQAAAKARAALKTSPEGRLDAATIASLERALARLRTAELSLRRKNRSAAPPTD